VMGGGGIAVGVRVGDKTTPLFEGLLVRLRMEARGGVPRLVATCKDKAWALTRPRRSAIYPDSSDADAVGTILARAGVEQGELGGEAATHEELVQWDATDWDFILARAAANGLAVVVKDGTLSMRDWRGKEAPVSISHSDAIRSTTSNSNSTRADRARMSTRSDGTPPPGR